MGTATSRGRRRRGATTAALIAMTLVATSGCTLYGIGGGARGQLGTGFLSDHAQPVPVARNPGWVAIDAGYDQSCAIDEHAALYCWGANDHGQVGVGVVGGTFAVPARVGDANDWTQVTTNHDHACGIRAGGSLHCWGSNAFAELGDGTLIDRSVPTQVAGTGWSQVSTGGTFTCGRRAGELHCWGYGPLGIEDQDLALVPIRVGDASDWTSVEAGVSHACGIRAPGSLHCWGRNIEGAVGDGTQVDREVPTPVGTGTNWMAVSAAEHSCGIRRATGTQAGRLWCWGKNDDGQVGDGTKVDRLVPVVVGTDADWRAVSAGWRNTCGIRATWLAYCWRNNFHGQLGVPAGEDIPTPTKLPGDDWGTISTGYTHVLGARNI